MFFATSMHGNHLCRHTGSCTHIHKQNTATKTPCRCFQIPLPAYIHRFRMQETTATCSCIITNGCLWCLHNCSDVQKFELWVCSESMVIWTERRIKHQLWLNRYQCKECLNLDVSYISQLHSNNFIRRFLTWNFLKMATNSRITATNSRISLSLQQSTWKLFEN